MHPNPPQSSRSAPARSGSSDGAAGWVGTRRALAAALVLLTGVLTVLGAATADPASALALCLFRTAQFTTWPPGSFTSTTAPIVIAVVGRDPFGSALDDMFRGERVGDREFVLKRFRAEESPGDCHLLFIGDVEEGRGKELLRGVEGRAVLTVSRRENFCASGGMVQLSVEKGRAQIQIRRDAVQNARLAIDSRLLNLKLVRIYGEPDRR